MARFDTGISRRQILAGGGLGVGLLVAWAAWPRRHVPNLVAAPGETIFNAFLKIGEDGHIVVVVPQAEYGQGVFTTLPQIVADELGADWRTIAVEPAPVNPLYANRLLATQMAGDLAPEAFDWAAADYATRSAMMMTGGSTSVRAFEAPMRQAAATARVMLCEAAAARWGIAWESCDTQAGFVIADSRRLRFGELAAEAAAQDIPAQLPMRVATENRLTGQSLPRLDIPSKIDGSANFAGDVRLPDMLYASIRQGPIGDSRLVAVDKAAADRIRGVVAVVENPRWVAAVATNWWAANRALDAMAPRFETTDGLVDDASIDAALARALDEGDGDRIAARGDLATSFRDATVHVADYSVAPAAHAAIETMTATADWSRDTLELWIPTQAPTAARAAAARALAIDETRVVVHPVLIGGSFGRALECDAAAQVAILARQMKRPVQLVWSRVEDIVHDKFRPPARARMTARLTATGGIDGWQAKIAAPASGHEIARRVLADQTAAKLLTGPDGSAVSGAVPPYAIANVAIDHHPADIGLPSGYWRSAADSYTAFFTESFIDELARLGQSEPFSYRMAMLGGSPRLAHCLSTAAALAGWQGGGVGSGQGIACHSSRGSHVAVVADARIEGAGKIVVDRIVAVADVGRLINPDIVRQQIEGGVIFGMAAALGASTGFERGLTTARRLSDFGLPTLADMPDLTIELVASDEAPGGVSEVAVPPVAPAIANALFAASGRRLRSLPLRPGAPR
jgi:isoquinoline 1-oxidoreductase beta subunit